MRLPKALRPALALLGGAMLALGAGGCAGTGTAGSQGFPMGNPIARSGNVIRQGNARFTLLTPALVRMEWNADAHFEDRASFDFPNRLTPEPVPFTTRREGKWIIVETDDIELSHEVGSGRFNATNLRVRVKATGQSWFPGKPDTGNLLGTVRTLDGVSGATPLRPGFLSRDGWAVIDDSKTVLFGADGWVEPRRPEPAQDFYLFGHGRDYRRALRDYTLVSGPVPLPPRWVFGSWWSRYWAYTDQELRDLVAEFRQHDVPLDVLVVDMDWHLDGWTGYTWNPKFFPDPQGFLDWTKSEGLRTTLNLHPHDGVRSHEAMFPEFARAVGQDPTTTDHIPFAVADRTYMDAYFKLLHHPYERMGVDFWWMDWQQGSDSGVEGLDPLFWLNHLHWKDMLDREAQTNQRPLIFSRWASYGSSRTQIGFSGDTYCNWESLAFQPYFTATASNVLFPYWSHDIGGHQRGPVEGELYARWIQFGAFSPILRTHTTKNPLAERRIWAFAPEVFHAAREAFRLRYALIPYIYTAARQCTDEALPIVRPLYYEWPENPEAYSFKDQYLFGDQFLVAPVITPREPASGVAATRVWFPPGTWTHWFTGETFTGPAQRTLLSSLDEFPLFVRSGGIIPMMPVKHRSDETANGPIAFHVFPGAEGALRLYEDDGNSPAHRRRTKEGAPGEFSITPVSMKFEDGTVAVRIAPAEGSFAGMPTQRDVEVHLHGIWKPDGVTQDGSPLPADALRYDADTQTAILTLPARDVRSATELRVPLGTEDRGALRRGLRGRLALLRALAARTGVATPEAAQRWLKAPQDPAQLPALARELEAQWSTLADAFAAATKDEALAREAVLRMLGVVPRFRMENDNRAILTAAAEVELLRPMEDLRAEWQIEVPESWTPITRLDLRRRPLTMEQPVRFEERFQMPGGVARAADLKATILLTSKGRSYRIPFTQTLFPSINDWYVTGPFDAPWDDEMKAVHPPELSQDFGRTFPGKGGTISWRRASRTTTMAANAQKEFFVDLGKLLGPGPHEYVVGYAVTHANVLEAQDAILHVGSDDGLVVWVNGEEVFRHHIGRPYTPREERIPVRLLPGTNTILLKVQQGQAEWGFAAWLETPDGKPLEARIDSRGTGRGEEEE